MVKQPKPGLPVKRNSVPVLPRNSQLNAVDVNPAGIARKHWLKPRIQNAYLKELAAHENVENDKWKTLTLFNVALVVVNSLSSQARKSM